MNVTARAVAPLCTLPVGECDIVLFERSGNKLELGIQRNEGKSTEIILITFERYFSVFIADEGDLPRYWSTDQFKGGGHLFEISGGGLLWNESQLPGLLTVSAAMPNAREWFVSTSGECITVIFDIEPYARVARVGHVS